MWAGSIKEPRCLNDAHHTKHCCRYGTLCKRRGWREHSQLALAAIARDVVGEDLGDGRRYIHIASGFCYLAAILDACSRKVVVYAISRNIDTTLPWPRCDQRCRTDSLRLAASFTRTGDRNMQVKPIAGPCRKRGCAGR